MQDTFIDARQALERIHALGHAVPRRVCQHPFKHNDIVWVCRTCQADETCVLCHTCWSQSNHEGHDIAFYHAQAGGCCDCGDPDAWDPAGFCPHHGPDASLPNAAADPTSAVTLGLVNRLRGVVPAIVDWMVQSVTANAEEGYRRAHPDEKEEDYYISNDSEQTQLDDVRRTLTDEGVRVDPATMQFQLEASSTDQQEQQQQDVILIHPPSASPRPLSASAARAQVFSPTAASSDRDGRDAAAKRLAEERAESMGQVGARGKGLYIVLFNDDIHSNSQMRDGLREFFGENTFYNDTILLNTVNAVRQYGHVVVWGNTETAMECGLTTVGLWMDFDKVASTRIGAIVLERANRLTKHGLFCSILTREELIVEQRALHVMQWLSAVACSCDPLCKTVAECILPNRHLVPLLRADFKLNARVAKTWYSLLLTLLAVPKFKSHLAVAYCDTYRNVTAKYARGMGVVERSGYQLSVQFLNRVAYVVDLVQGRDLLGKLGKAVLETLLVARDPALPHSRLNPNHSVLNDRRYSPCISDLKCVLNVKGMPRLVACENGTFLDDWVTSLSAAQQMDAHIWRHWSEDHVVTESRGWVNAFNATILLGSLFERLLSWDDSDPSPIQDPSSRYSSGLLPCVEMTFRIIAQGVNDWQQKEFSLYQATPCSFEITPHRRCPNSLPFSTVAARRGTAVAMRQLPISQVTPFSFHLPLHRFVSSCLRELCLRNDSTDFGVSALLEHMRNSLNETLFDDIFLGLMEFPSLVVSRASQIRAGLWRRNGYGLNDQVLNYSEPPFCRTMRDADLLLMQFAVVGRTRFLSPDARPGSDVGMAFLVNLLLHRFGIFEFLGFAKAPAWNVDQYKSEVNKGMYLAELPLGGAEKIDSPLPWAHSPAQDVPSSLVLVEEFLHFMIVFLTELPLVTPEDRARHTEQTRWKLQREVVHRLAYGPKTHSELSDVQHVLCHRDIVLLGEEGKFINPDDASGAVLGVVLADVADRKASRAALEPDKWELKRSAWELYDPAFFHVSPRHHQTAAEMRPKPSADREASFGWETRPLVPRPPAVHPFFHRLRRDVTADATVLATVCRIIHLHCVDTTDKSFAGLRGRGAYDSKEFSETALARSVHLLTIGAYAWMDATKSDDGWREKGGGSAGSIFFDRSPDSMAPDAGDWVSNVLLARPEVLTDCNWFVNEDPMLVMLKRLAVSGGVDGDFIAQDPALRSGAAWLCDFASRVSPEAACLIKPIGGKANHGGDGETELEKRKRLAKEKALARMQAQVAKFASMLDSDLGDDNDSAGHNSGPTTPQTSNLDGSVMSAASSVSTVASTTFSDHRGGNAALGLPLCESVFNDTNPPRLLRSRPRCIICNSDDNSDGRQFDVESGEGQRKRSKKKAENALGFVGYCQASTVLMGGGGPPPELSSSSRAARGFVGAHLTLCGHAIHSECCESYLATVSHRGDRAYDKREEFRCPLCQRLSNCLVPFIDVGLDWVVPSKSASTDNVDSMEVDDACDSFNVHAYLDDCPWWISRHNDNVIWDGHSAFILDEGEVTGSERGEGVGSERQAHKSSPRPQPRKIPVRSLKKKKDLYAAWNGMMKTPRFVRRKLRPRESDLDASTRPRTIQSDGEDSSGETLVWRRLMDQLSDVSYKSDCKRVSDGRLHAGVGEFRHYIVERYAYSVANRSDPAEWPGCMFTEILSESHRQEMSREKLLSKLLLTIQSFTYSSCCEAFAAKWAYRKHLASSSMDQQARISGVESVLSKFGIDGVGCEDNIILMPKPLPEEEGGYQPFNGRIGKLRYLGLSVMAAAAAVAADLVQLVLPFPTKTNCPEDSATDSESPLRAPIAYPLLFGHVLTHVTAAMCATCGRARARSDSLDLCWPLPFSSHGSFSLDQGASDRKHADSVIEDCEAFMNLGLIARLLQVLLGQLDHLLPVFCDTSSITSYLQSVLNALVTQVSCDELDWMRSCCKLIEVAISNHVTMDTVQEEPASVDRAIDAKRLREACTLAACEGSKFLSNVATVFQILVPTVVERYSEGNIGDAKQPSIHAEQKASWSTLEKLRQFLRIESLEDTLQSPLVREVVSNWYNAACEHSKAASQDDDDSTDGPWVGRAATLRRNLYRTEGFRCIDWPLNEASDRVYIKKTGNAKDDTELMGEPHHDNPHAMQVDNIRSATASIATSTADLVRREPRSTLVTCSPEKTVPLLGGYVPDNESIQPEGRPRLSAMPTSYTDLYAELGSLLPDCTQTAVCLICGQVLNAGGFRECTNHAIKCGAGTGLFFLLQDCSGLILHKNKAAYVHSPYVDSHGETPQFRGRPLNLDLVRYEHLRELWMTHGIRQTVMERTSTRQMIMLDF